MVRRKKNGRKDDEDYEVPEDETEASEDDCLSLDEEASGESAGDYEDDDDEEGKKEEEKVVKSRKRKSSSTRSTQTASRKRRRLPYKHDEEYTPEEDVDSDEENDLITEKKKNGRRIRKRSPGRKAPTRRNKKRQTSRRSKYSLRKRDRTRIRISWDGELDEHIELDSDFVSSDSSDASNDEYTVSEEESEQMLTGSSKIGLRGSSSSRTKPENKKGKSTLKKGKKQTEKVKNQAVKQKCGICLSEEDIKTVRGILDCCTHYFCFDCIKDWANVESRCPLCKQRFKTICKPTTSHGKKGSRREIVRVPERDQAYQPTEEEIMSYVDPFWNVTCIECDGSEDDDLLLICDICNSAAHTYCVGLGNQVPEGNWYCGPCRNPVVGTPPRSDQGASSNQRAQ